VQAEIGVGVVALAGVAPAIASGTATIAVVAVSEKVLVAVRRIIWAVPSVG
jgi:hypothetical protein